MIVYQYMPSKFALANLRNRRLKVSLLEDLNDPFELLGARLDRWGQRKQIHAWREKLAASSRLLCFSRTYMNSLMWSHYADKHRGICLAFDVPRQALDDVNYEPSRLEIDFEVESRAQDGISDSTTHRLLTTKYLGW